MCIRTHAYINVHTHVYERAIFQTLDIRQYSTVTPERQKQVRPLIVTAYRLESVSRLQCKEGKPRQSLADPLGRGDGAESLERPRQLKLMEEGPERREPHRENLEICSVSHEPSVETI